MQDTKFTRDLFPTARNVAYYRQYEYRVEMPRGVVNRFYRKQS